MTKNPINTKRLVIRPLQEDDHTYFERIRGSEAYSRYTTRKSNTQTDFAAKIADRMQRAQQQPPAYWSYMIVLTETGDVIGDIRAFANDPKMPTIAEIGYGMDPDYWGRGYMTEALGAFIIFGHDVLRLHRIVVRAHKDNIGSWRVAEKAGMAHEGIMRYAIPLEGGGWMPEIVCYASVRPDLAV